MRRLAWIVLVAAAPVLAAQQPPDSGAARQLRELVRQRWNERVRSSLGLSDDQAAKLQSTEQRFEEQRQPLRLHQRETNQALRAELQASAPNQDRVRQLMSEQQDTRLKMQQLDQAQDRDMQGYLTPVQRARYQNERRQFQERVAEIIRQRREARRERLAPRGGARRRPRP